MDGKKKVPPPRPVTVAKKKMPVSDWLACGWALLSACAIALGHYHRLFCSQATLIVRCGSVELTGKKAIYFSALWIGALCCAASQAAAAALALLLPRRHRWVSREDLAFLAVVLNSAGHCMYNGSVYILRRGDYFTVASLWFWVGDIISSLLLQGSVRLSFTLLRACATAFGLYHLPCSEATLVLRCACVELTGTKAAFFSALWIGILCCTASQAAAAALALLLPRRHRRVSRELASLALVLATAGHSMYNGAAYLLRAEY